MNPLRSGRTSKRRSPRHCGYHLSYFRSEVVDRVGFEPNLATLKGW